MDEHTLLKPCPFCGGKAMFVTTSAERKLGFYRCENYCIEQCHVLVREDAQEEWNRRAEDGK